MRISNRLAILVAALVAAPPLLAGGDFSDPRVVMILGYDDDAMEPFVTSDYLLFNNRNDPAVNTDLHYAERVDDLTFQYRGLIAGANTGELEGTPTLDRDDWLYFVSTRSYFTTFSSIYRARFSAGAVSQVELVPNVSLEEPGMINFDVGVSRDGRTLYIVDGLFDTGGVPLTADLVMVRRKGDSYARLPATERMLAAVNTPVLEYAPAVSADGLQLYFTRWDPGGGGLPFLCVARRARAGLAFGKALPIPAAEGFVEAPALSPDEGGLYYHRLDADGRFRIYRVSR